VGYQRLAVAGAGVLVAGTLMLALGPPGAGVLWASAAAAVIGVGMGLFSAPLLIVIQASVEWGRRGAATALNQFARTIGGAVGVSLMGVLLESFVSSAADPLAARTQLAAGLAAVFWVLVGLSLLALATALAMLRWSPALGTGAQPGREPGREPEAAKAGTGEWR
jgi:MFS family permease